MRFPFFSVPMSPALARKESRAMAVHFRMRTATWSARTYNGYSTEGYAMNVVAYQAIRRLATSIAQITWAVKVNGQLVHQHPFLDLIHNPNPAQTAQEWWEAKIGFLYLAGTGYDERQVVAGRVKELWAIRPDRMGVTIGKTGLPSSYTYQSGMKKVTWPANTITGDSDIYQTRLFSPTDDVHGLSPFSAGAFAIDVHNETMKWLKALLENAAAPSGALVLDKDSRLSDEEFDRLAAEVETNYAGARNAGRPMLLEGGMDWKPMGMSPHDMTMTAIKDSVARDISLAFGIPPLLLNIPGDNTYSNYGEARRGFYEDTVIPLATFVSAGLNKWLSKQFFNGAELVPDLDRIEAIAKKRRELWEMVDSADEITVNEARGLKGLPPLTDARGDLLLAELRKGTNEPQTEENPDV